jgi:hypothetical protein
MNMRFYHSTRAVIGAPLLVGLLLATLDDPIAAPDDYRFEFVEAQPAGPRKTDVAVRLVHLPDQKPVAGAALFKPNMGPVMAEIPGNVWSLPSDQPELYRFRVETVMAGRWTLFLAAKVQGEAETVRGSVIFDVAK